MSEKDSGGRLPAAINTLIGPAMRVEGSIRCGGVLRVQGAVAGNVACDAGPDGALVVDAAGSVEGNVSARHIAVRGRIAGPLQSSGAIEIHQGGTVDGDISFRQLAIHAGGVVEGVLKPLPAEEGGADAEAAMPQQPATAGAGLRRAAIAALLVAVAAGAAWKGREMLGAAPAPEDAPPRAEAPLPKAAPEAPAPAEAEARKESLAHPLAQSAALAAPAAAPAAEAGMEISTVRGANPSRPANVFLLIANEPAVLYRKKRDEPGEGVRVAVSAGEKASVSIAPDELIRIEKGSDVTIFYQGQKVPRQFIAGGSWIAFVAR